MVGDKRTVWDIWIAAELAEDLPRASHCAELVIHEEPESYEAWFFSGLHAKALGQWTVAAERTERAVALLDDEQRAQLGGQNPAAWNLGIAATALGDWARARDAWREFGIPGVEEGEGPLEMDLGLVPIRVNPATPGLPFQTPPNHGRTEVLWCRRLSPAHARVVSVPLPGSGHRHGDVLLHDGAPTGSRWLGEQELPVFDELERLHASDTPTWKVVVAAADAGTVDALIQAATAHGIGAESWTGLDVEGDAADELAATTASVPADAVVIGLAGSEEDVVTFLREWAAAQEHAEVVERTRL